LKLDGESLRLAKFGLTALVAFEGKEATHRIYRALREWAGIRSMAGPMIPQLKQQL
jgi:hypothetical protein